MGGPLAWGTCHTDIQTRVCIADGLTVSSTGPVLILYHLCPHMSGTAETRPYGVPHSPGTLSTRFLIVGLDRPNIVQRATG